MKPVIIIAIAFVLLFTPLISFAQEEEEFVNENNCEVDSDSLINEILTHEPENFDAWYQGGITEYNCGRYNVASTFFSAAIKLDPDHEQAKIYYELNEQRFQEHKRALQEESDNIVLIIMGIGVGVMVLISWYYKNKKKKDSSNLN